MKVSKSTSSLPIFSSSHYKSERWLDISVSCAMFDDESFSSMSMLYNVARDRGIDNILFVLAEDVYKKKLSYTPFFTITGERYIYGLDCDSIEPADYAPLVDNSRIIHDLGVIVRDFMSSSSFGGTPMSLATLDLDDISRGGRSPLRRNILVLLDKPFRQYVTRDLADSIIRQIVAQYRHELVSSVRMLVENAYVGFSCLESLNKVTGSSLDEYYSDRESYLRRAEDYMRSSMDISYIAPDYPIEGIEELKTIDGIEARLPDGTPLRDLVSSDIDTLLDARYLVDLSLDAYISGKRRLQSQPEPHREPAPSGMIDIRSYTDESLSEALERDRSYVLITYATKDPADRILFMFPDKKILYSEYEEIRAAQSAGDAGRDLERLARMSPTSDDEVMDKAAVFPDYDALVREIVSNGVDLSSDEIFSQLYGTSHYELCSRTDQGEN